MPRVYLSLGSNLGNRIQQLNDAVNRLAIHSIEVLRLSSIYETEPQDVTAQPWFLNQVAECETALPPLTLLRRLQHTERAGGRDRANAIRRGPRLIDLDILLYADCVLTTKRLIIPHPRLTERRFVLEPLLELNPSLVNPETGLPLSTYLKQTETQKLTIHNPREASTK